MKLECRKTTIHAVRDACWMHLCSTFCNGRRFRISPRQPSSLIESSALLSDFINKNELVLKRCINVAIGKAF